MKALALPYWQIPSGLGGGPSAKEHKEASLSDALVPRLDKVRAAQARLDRHIALLRCVEALRLYAAGHDGKLPAKLTDVGAPVPVDPFTGKTFVYRLEGDRAVVRGTPPPGLEGMAAFNVRYEVTIRK